MFTLASILIEFGSESAFIAPLVLFNTSILVNVCGLVVYFRRIFLIQNHKSYGYVDFLGPIFLSTAALFGIGATLFQSFGLYGMANTVPLKQQAIRSEPNQCVMLGLGGRSPLNYQPSDILVDTARGNLVVPSLKEITEISMDAEDTTVRGIAEIAEADIQALIYARGVIFAMSESNKKSELFALKRDQGEDNLRLFGRWMTNSVGVESMVYIPRGNKYGEKVIIANQGIDVYSLPSPLNTTTDVTGYMIYPTQSINKRLICRGLEENCKIGSMQFFEGLLYILHDNARVIRSWDLKLAQIMAEYTLPWVGGGFKKQRVGMALVRKKSINEGDSGNGPKSSLILYLSLDTPAMVWCIAINEGIEGRWEFPSCAGGS